MCVYHVRGLVYGSGACAPATFVGPGGTSVVVFPVGQAPRQGDNQRFTAVRRVAIYPRCFFASIALFAMLQNKVTRPVGGRQLFLQPSHVVSDTRSRTHQK